MENETSQAERERIASDLGEVRNTLLALHTLLLGMERASYEAEYGVQTSGQMLKLVLEDPRFTWLRSISELIVRIDVLLDEEEPLTAATAGSVVRYSVDLMSLSDDGSVFQRRYLQALQDEPDVIFAHRDTQQALARAKANLGEKPTPK